MARRPNYGQQRAEVNRAKQAKTEARQREREEAVARRKAAREDPSAPAAEGAGDQAGPGEADAEAAGTPR
jgi:hypothetical protein